jgi:hypothetical protein
MGKSERKPNISSILDKTADVITMYGWNRGGGWWNGGTIRGRLCVEGALQVALNLPNDRNLRTELVMHPAYQFLQNYIGLHPGRPLHAWNDDYVTTGREVITLLRHAAEQARCIEKENERRKKEESMKHRMKLSFKAIASFMNSEMDEFERSIQTSVPEKEKELIDA